MRLAFVGPFVHIYNAIGQMMGTRVTKIVLFGTKIVLCAHNLHITAIKNNLQKYLEHQATQIEYCKINKTIFLLFYKPIEYCYR